jgi:hypothetical protein
LFPASLPSGLPRNPNVLLIRTHPNPSPSVANTSFFKPSAKNYSLILNSRVTSNMGECDFEKPSLLKSSAKLVS